MGIWFISAATMKKAAEDISLGIIIFVGLRKEQGWSLTVFLFIEIFAPKALIILSVWSLDLYTSVTSTSLLLHNSANKIHDLTWAEEEPVLYVIFCRVEGINLIGARPLLEVTIAFIRVNGLTIRCIGLLERELSPESIEEKFWADKIPLKSLQ